jgi:AmmeMemoRadiSam system protein B/AmmeMemoRadiSam system protein A
MPAVRPPVLTGTWYPSDPAQLRREVDALLEKADPDRLPGGKPVIMLVPHAGYAYSGPVAGQALGLLRGLRYDAVFVLAPSHRKPLQRPALTGLDAFATPLGEVPVAGEIRDALAASGAFSVDDRAHAFEHAVEILLPMLQRTLPEGTPLVPILVPRLDDEARRAAADALARWRDGRHLFVVSSDLTHYGREFGFLPFAEDIPRRLEQLDSGALLRFLAHDAPGLLQYGRQSGITMCGLDAAALVLSTPPPDDHEAALIAYARSGDQTGDWDHSVSYGAAVICDPEPAPPPGRDGDPATSGAGSRATPAQDAGDGPDTAEAGDRDPGAGPLTADERAFLVRLARRAAAAAATSEPPCDPAVVAAELGLALSPRLLAPRGAFVTLHRGGQLRGCIGFIEPVAPLVRAVVDNAMSAAVRDSRFPPLREDELDDLEVEVSALTPLREVSGPREIIPGRHGILLRRGRRQAVFLPQVATEQGWDLATTLDHLALKAGLPADAWREGCTFEVFEAEICRE